MYDTSAGVAVLRSDTIAKTTPQGISNITYECVDPIYELADKNLQFEVYVAIMFIRCIESAHPINFV